MVNNTIQAVKVFIKKENTKCNQNQNIEIRRIPVNWYIGNFNKTELSDFSKDSILNPDYDSLINLINKTIPYLLDNKYILSWKDSDDDNIVFTSTDELQHALKQSKDLFKLYVKTVINEQVFNRDAHTDVSCDGCHSEVKGDRYKCTVCYDYDLCHRCQCSGVHDIHDMLCIRLPGGLANYPCLPQTPLNSSRESSSQQTLPKPPSFENFMNMPNPWKGGKPWGFGPSRGARGPPPFMKRWVRQCQMNKYYNMPDFDQFYNDMNESKEQPPNKKQRTNKACYMNTDNAGNDKDAAKLTERNSCRPGGRSRGGPPFGPPFGPPSWARRSGPPPMMFDSPYNKWPTNEWPEYNKEGLGCGAGRGIAPRSPVEMSIEDENVECDDNQDNEQFSSSSLQCKCGARGPNRCVCSQEARRSDLSTSNTEELPPCCSPAMSRSLASRESRTPSCCKK